MPDFLFQNMHATLGETGEPMNKACPRWREPHRKADATDEVAAATEIQRLESWR